ncbi:MAG: SDR family NAD(P)-dependent oxidoreductase [Candidatus Melainabacteria bacterium]|nr:SDR family NAD(P)-dependent oxidoreductase [Candidatus Melainabacteria bacterium]MBI3308954.1 SDR family NAD(P)-dependent oxidoreductase [Candidatus Melainabacteria bacterium]
MLKGKTALVTGASQGIGKAIIQALANEGCNVILHYFQGSKNIKKLIKELEKYNVTVSAYSVDLTKVKEVKKLFNKISKNNKSLDILVNNVGNYLKKPLEKLTISEWHEIIDSNLHLTFYCTYYALPLLRKSKHGRIINIGFASTGQIVAKPNILPYQIAKTGILLMTKALAKAEARNKVLVNMISPGVMENSIHLPKKEIPLKRSGKLSGLAELVVQTINSDYTTGAHIEYAGGFNL